MLTIVVAVLLLRSICKSNGSRAIKYCFSNGFLHNGACWEEMFLLMYFGKCEGCQIMPMGIIGFYAIYLQLVILECTSLY